MALSIYTNVNSLSTQLKLNISNASLSTSMERLSSGLRVNSSKDDAAGLAIATRMDTQARGMTVAIRNANDGISLSQTAEGAIGELTNVLQRMRDLAVQSANGGAISSTDRQKLQNEFKQMGQELARNISNTSFNGLKILQGQASGKNFQVGWSTATNNQISITIPSMGKASGISMMMLGQMSIGSMATSAKTLSAINKIDIALNTVNTARSKLGAIQNRFTSAISNLEQSVQNITAAKSRIMDADFAAETSNLSRSQILQQAGMAMLSQANQSNQSVLSLLR